MPARAPLDVDLEDKLLYGLTPMRLAYLMLALVAGFALWSSHWGPVVVRAAATAILISAGVAAAWGRWRGRATDEWAIDIALFIVSNHRVSWRAGRLRPRRSRSTTVLASSSELEDVHDVESLADAA